MKFLSIVTATCQIQAYLNVIDHLLCSRHCMVHITGIISFNLDNRLISNLPNAKKLLSG